MKKNMGMTDKIIRLIGALVLIIVALTNVVSGVWEIVMLIIALMLVVTSMINFCPLYLPFGIDTSICCKKKEKQ